MMFDMVKEMFRQAWQQRLLQAAEAVKSAKRQIQGIEKQVDALLLRIMDATNQSVVRAYESKIGELEHSKHKLQDKLAIRTAPNGTFDDMLELSLKFLANPWKLWESGQITLRRTVLRLAFSERLAYHRNEGPRTPKTALVFKVLGGILDGDVRDGAAEKTRTSTGISPQRPQRCASTSSATAAHFSIVVFSNQKTANNFPENTKTASKSDIWLTARQAVAVSKNCCGSKPAFP